MAFPDATLLNYPEKCTMEGKGPDNHLAVGASNMELNGSIHGQKGIRD